MEEKKYLTKEQALRGLRMMFNDLEERQKDFREMSLPISFYDMQALTWFLMGIFNEDLGKIDEEKPHPL